MAVLRTSYGPAADDYEAYWGASGFAPTGKLRRDLREILEQEIGKASGPVLDYGCGDGKTLLPYATEKAWRYTGADLSSAALSQARRYSRQFGNFAAKRFCRIQEISKTIPPKSLGLIFCLEVLEHLTDPEIVLRRLLPLLRPDGALVVTVPNIIFWRHRVDFFVLGRFNPNGDDLSLQRPWRDPHLRFFTPASLRNLMGRVGLQRVRIRGFEGGFWKVLPWPFRKMGGEYSSRFYFSLAQVFPSWFAGRLVAVGEVDLPARSLRPMGSGLARPVSLGRKKTWEFPSQQP